MGPPALSHTHPRPRQPVSLFHWTIWPGCIAAHSTPNPSVSKLQRGNVSPCLGTGLLGAESQAWATRRLGSRPSSASFSPCDPGPVPALPWGWGLASQTPTLVLHFWGLHKPTRGSGFLSFPRILLPNFQLQGRKQAEQCGGGVGGSNPRHDYHGVTHLPLRKTPAQLCGLWQVSQPL